MATYDSMELDALLAEAGWVRALARRLLGDEDLADDVSQETWLIGLERARTGPLPTRAWLAGVLRNRVFKLRRAAARRRARESSVAKDERLPSTADLVARAAVHGEVVRVVTELDEIYRSVILMRYLDEKTPDAIAIELGLPVSTVKTRLARGLERLRRKLDARYDGDDRAWAIALAPFAGVPVPRWATTTVIGGAWLAPGAAIAAAVVAVLVFARLTTGDREPGASGNKDQVPLSAVAAPSSTSVARAASNGRPATRAPIEVPGAALSPSTDARAGEIGEGVVELRGRVFDTLGTPVAGLRVTLHATRPGERVTAADSTPSLGVTTSAGDGSFALRTPHVSGVLLADSDAFATVFSCDVTPELADARWNLVVAPRGRCSGRVVDGGGAAVEGAYVRYVVPRAVRNAPGCVMDLSEPVEYAARTDDGGDFALDRLPLVDGAEWVVTRPGYAATRVAWPPVSSDRVVLQLERIPIDRDMLTGVVVDADGRLVRDARVSLGLDSTRSNDDGVFAFDRELGRASSRLTAFREGAGMATIELDRDEFTGELFWPDTLCLRLAGPSRAIAGTIVDTAGDPLAGLRVWARDATLFSIEEEGAVIVESALAGVSHGHAWATTDANGAFEVRGLADRSYELVALDVLTLEQASLGRIPAGARGDAYTFERPSTIGPVRGRVVDAHGRGLAGVGVKVSARTYEGFYGGRDVFADGVEGRAVVTGPDGEFDLGVLPATVRAIVAFSASRLPSALSLADIDGPLDDLVLPVARRVHLRVRVSGASVADQVAVEARDGSPLDLLVFSSATRRLSARRLPLVDGCSDTFAVGERAQTLLLLRGGKVVRRVPLDRVHAGQVNSIDL